MTQKVLELEEKLYKNGRVSISEVLDLGDVPDEANGISLAVNLRLFHFTAGQIVNTHDTNTMTLEIDASLTDNPQNAGQPPAELSPLWSPLLPEEDLTTGQGKIENIPFPYAWVRFKLKRKVDANEVTYGVLVNGR